MLDVCESAESKLEGLSRELINRMQKQRKAAKLDVHDACEVFVEVTPKESMLFAVIEKFKSEIETATRQTMTLGGVKEEDAARVIDATVSDVKDVGRVKLTLVDRRKKQHASSNEKAMIEFEFEGKTVALKGDVKMERMLREIRAAFGLHTRLVALVDAKSGAKTTDLNGAKKFRVVAE